MDDATNNNTLQPSFSGTRKRNASITSEHQADIKRAKKAEYNKRYREKQSVLHMAQKIISRQKHNMLSLLHEACLKLLVFFYVVLFTHYSKRLAQILLNPLCVFSLTLWIQTHIRTITHITGIYRITTINVFTFYSDYLDHQLCNNSNQLYAHSTLCMYRCDDKRHFSLNASLHTSQT
jgi:hypothetical protein